MPVGSSNTPVSKFFKPYTNYGFYYNPADSANSEFRRLHRHMKWQRPKGVDPPPPPPLAGRIARFQFGQALIQQFGESFGEDVDSLDSWQALCAAVYIDPVPETLEEAQIVSNLFRMPVMLTEHSPGTRIRPSSEHTTT